MFEWLEATSVARAVAESLTLTAVLSATHVLGFTLATSGALAANLRLIGAVFWRQPLGDVLRPTSRAIAIGLAVSVGTGVLLFSARAVDASANGTFRLKMALLVLAGAFQFVIGRTLGRGTGGGVPYARALGALGLLLWAGLAAAACAFILLE